MKKQYVQVAVATSLICLFTFGRWAGLGGDFSTFIGLSENFVLAEEFNQQVKFSDFPYDGLSFYRYALNPWSPDERRRWTKKDKASLPLDHAARSSEYTFAGIVIDNPSMRRKRIGYPLLANLISFGQNPFVPTALVFLNGLVFLGIVWLGYLFCQYYKIPPIWSLFLLCQIGLYLSLARDLADMMAFFFGFAAYIVLLHNRLVFFALLAFFALLVKENIILWLIGLTIPLFWEMLRASKINMGKALILSMPIIAYFVYRIGIDQYYGLASEGDITHHFSFPFVGLVSGLSVQGSILKLGLWFIPLLPILALTMLAIRQIWNEKRSVISNPLAMAFLLNLLAAMLFTSKIYEDFWSYGRNLIPLQIAAVLLLLQKDKKLPVWMTGLGVATASVFFVLLLLIF